MKKLMKKWWLGSLALALALALSIMPVQAALTTTINVNIDAKHTSSLDLSTGVDRLVKTISLSLATGTGASQADLIFHDSRTLATGANEELDLAGGLTDAFGSTLTFVKIKFLAIKCNTAGQTLTIGGAAANAWEAWTTVAGATIKVVASGSWLILVADPAGMAVTAGTGDLLKILNSAGATVTYEIIVIGTSA